MEEQVTHQHILEQIRKRINYEKGALGTVEALALCHEKPNEVLIAWQRGLCVRWDLKQAEIKSFFRSSRQLEAIDWVNSEKAILAFGDGSLITWEVENDIDNADQTDSDDKIGVLGGNISGPYHRIIYGPESCKPITRVRQIGDLTVFQGGLPRASYGDRYCITAMSSQSHVAFDFSSKIVSFSLTPSLALLVLCEEEFVAIDLSIPSWPPFRLPYLSPIHSSALTAVNVKQVTPELIKRISSLSEGRTLHSENAWPCSGGRPLGPSADQQAENVLLTGHEDGSVRLWRLAGNGMQEIAKITTMQYFNTDDEPPEEDISAGEEWPPFRKCGLYDPYSDDPRLGVRRVDMCPKSGSVVVGGTAGQVVVFVLVDRDADHLVQAAEVDLFETQTKEQKDKFKWKGHPTLNVKDERHFETAGYQVQCVVQASPPAAITALALEASWNLIGLGTSHGFALFDYRRLETVKGVVRCTLETSEVEAQGGFTRGKSFRKSLRQTMHRIRSSFRSRQRSQRRPGSGRRPMNVKQSKVDQANQKLKAEDFGHRDVRIERRLPTVETSGEGAVVRTMHFATTNFKDGLGISPTFWCGTAGGCVFFYALSVPDYNDREEAKVAPISAKTLQMQHRAPVLGIDVIGPNGPLDNSTSHNHSSHQLVITTEEQVKGSVFSIYSLPKVQFKKKFKLTALEGSLIKKARFARYKSKENSVFHCLSVLTNQGEIILFNLDAHKIVVTDHRFEDCIDKDNHNGIFYSCLTVDGQGLYLLSQSEFQRFSTNSHLPAASPCRVSAL